MKSTALEAILSASVLLLCIPLASTQSFAPSYIGCYKSVSNYANEGLYQYQSPGHCSEICAGKNVPYMAFMEGSTCFCGSALPDSSLKVSEMECDSKCFGWGQQTCGGKSAYGVWADGVSQYTGPTIVNVYPPTQVSQPPPSSTTTQAPSVITEAGHTVVVTAPGQTATADSSSSTSTSISTSTGSGSSSSSGPSTAAIAAGVVVGIVGLSAIVGAAFFYIRLQKRRAVEAEYRRNAALNDFVDGGKKPPATAMSNSRWDGDFMAERRQSNGSIADDQDFSRRILKVTNPDR